VAKVSCVMEAMLYSLGVESNSETITIIDTNRDGFSVPIKYATEGSLSEEADLWDTPANARPYLLSVADMYQVERLKLHYAYSHMIGRLYALIIPNLCTISVEDYLKGCTMVPCSFNVLFKYF
jgi:hypothetical protein